MAEMEKEMNETPVEETVEETAEVIETNPWEEKYNAERDAHLRIAAEYDNFRKRTVKEKEQSYGNGKADAVAKMLPIYDNLERALNQPTEDAAYKKGVEMTMNELVKIFTGLGVEIFGNVGDAFDPNFPEVSEKRNNGKINYGIALMKYTGSRGKSGSSDASPELIAMLRRQFGDAVGIAASVGEHPAVTGRFLPLFSEPLAIVLRVTLDPTLKMVAVGGGKDFASSEIVSKMCHDFLSFSLGRFSPSL